jgi:hypothetical protein
MRVPDTTLQGIQRHFHALIRERAAEYGVRKLPRLPQLAPLAKRRDPRAWFAVPGMCGGFSYWFEGEGAQTKLICESWVRVVVGSEQRHQVAAEGVSLIEEDFMGGIVTVIGRND